MNDEQIDAIFERVNAHQLAMETAPEAPAGEPVAWRYELATRVAEGQYTNWKWHVGVVEPHVPEGSIRNLTPLYAAPAPAADGEAVAPRILEALRECVNQLATIQHDRKERWSNERVNMVSGCLLMARRALKDLE